MKRRTFLTAAASLTQLAVMGGCARSVHGKNHFDDTATAAGSNKTNWTISPAIGLDACFVLTIAGAGFDVLQVEKHQHRRAQLREALGPDGVIAAEQLMDAMKRAHRSVPGAGLALMASVGEIDTLAGVIDTFRIEDVFEQRFAGTNFYQREGSAVTNERIRSIAAAAFEALARSDFENMWRVEEEPKLKDAASALAGELSNVDLIVEHRRYLSRALDPNVTIYLSELSEPHGIRIVGQRFVSSPNYSSLTVRRIAAHEIIHPLFEANRPETGRILAHLKNEPLLNAIVKNSNASFGYSSIRGLIEEGGTQALEAVINERLGQGRDQSEYWRHQDGGMHIFAAATYALMQDTGFADKGGDMLSWLDEQIQKQHLQDDALERLATSVVGAETVMQWFD